MSTCGIDLHHELGLHNQCENAEKGLEEGSGNSLHFSHCRERRWKIAQAKRFAKLVSKSNLDVEGRERLRRKEELLTLKKRAAWIAKEVGRQQQHAFCLFHRGSVIERKEKKRLHHSSSL